MSLENLYIYNPELVAHMIFIMFLMVTDITRLLLPMTTIT